MHSGVWNHTHTNIIVGMKRIQNLQTVAQREAPTTTTAGWLATAAQVGRRRMLQKNLSKMLSRLSASHSVGRPRSCQQWMLCWGLTAADLKIKKTNIATERSESLRSVETNICERNSAYEEMRYEEILVEDLSGHAARHGTFWNMFTVGTYKWSLPWQVHVDR